MSVACSHRRVLIIEDYADAADTLSAFLEATGYEVVTTYGGQSALMAACNRRPDVVLLDLNLPDINGYEVARRLRKRSGMTHVVIIALTSYGYGPTETRLRLQESGVDHHLVKPVDPFLLAAVIDSLPR